jgi:hypothetical protein
LEAKPQRKAALLFLKIPQYKEVEVVNTTPRRGGCQMTSLK